MGNVKYIGGKMQEIFNVWIWERAIERLLIVLFGGLSLVLGWYLFKLGILKRQEAELSGGGWKIKLMNVGPGVFFALFGSIVFIVAAVRPVSLEIPGNGKVSNNHNPINLNYGTEGPKIKLDLTPDDYKAINTVRYFFKRVKLEPTDGQFLKRAIDKLEILKRKHVFAKYPNMRNKYDDWAQKASFDTNFFNSINQEEKKEFLLVQKMLEDSFDTGGN